MLDWHARVWKFVAGTRRRTGTVMMTNVTASAMARFNQGAAGQAAPRRADRRPLSYHTKRPRVRKDRVVPGNVKNRGMAPEALRRAGNRLRRSPPVASKLRLRYGHAAKRRRAL